MATELQRQALKLRAEDYTIQEIADKMGCTKQNVSQLLAHGISENNYTRMWIASAKDVIYPNLKQWIIDNRMSITSFSKNCGYTSSIPVRNLIIYGRDGRKSVIDAILKVTGMSYEEAFRKDDSDEKD